jgi:hypothetical protein
MQSCANACDYGCAHGAAVGFFKKDPALLQKLNKACDMPTNNVPINSLQSACAHGMGHAIAEYSTLPSVEAIVHCDNFYLQDAREDCLSGYFMELYMPGMRQGEDPSFSDFFRVCGPIKGIAREICIQEMSTALYKKTADAKQALSFCVNLSEPARKECARGIGSTAYFLLRKEEKIAKEACALVPILSESCIEGIRVSQKEDRSGNVE